MKTRNLIVICSGLVCLTITVWFSTSTLAEQKIYEINASPMVPNGYSPSIDTNRLTDLISQLIEQNQQLNQNQLTELNLTLQEINKNILSIKQRLQIIEKAMKIQQTRSPDIEIPVENSDKKEARDLSKSSIAD